MKINVKWHNEELDLIPCDFDHERHGPTSSDTDLVFIHAGQRYKYSWASGGGMGLSALYQMEPDGKFKCVYDAWKRNWDPFHVTLHEAARQLAYLLKYPDKTPKP